MNIHWRTAADSLRRSPFQALSAIFVLSLTFFVGTLFAILVYSSDRVLTHFETRPPVIAFLKSDVEEKDATALRDKLSTDNRLKDVVYVSKEEALGIYKEATADNPLLAELVSPSIFPASIEFSLSDLGFAGEIIAELGDEEIVDDIRFTADLGGESDVADVIGRLKRVALYIRLGGGVFAGLLGLTSFLVLVVIIGMRMTSRKKEIEILDLIGATSKFIRSPVFIESFVYSVAGVLLGWVFALILVLYSMPSIINYFGQIPVLPRDSGQFFLIFLAILGIEILVGLLIAFIGSSMVVKRAKKLPR